MSHPDLQLVLSFKGVLELRESQELVRVRLGARSLDPLAVRLGVDTHDGPVNWVFARDLLVRGLHGRAGEGNVRVRPHPNPSRQAMVEVILDGVGGFARLLLPRGPVGHFLASSDPFTHGELSEELLLEDLEHALEEILTPGESTDPYDD